MRRALPGWPGSPSKSQGAAPNRAVVLAARLPQRRSRRCSCHQATIRQLHVLLPRGKCMLLDGGLNGCARNEAAAAEREKHDGLHAGILQSSAAPSKQHKRCITQMVCTTRGCAWRLAYEWGTSASMKPSWPAGAVAMLQVLLLKRRQPALPPLYCDYRESCEWRLAHLQAQAGVLGARY